MKTCHAALTEWSSARLQTSPGTGPGAPTTGQLQRRLHLGQRVDRDRLVYSSHAHLQPHLTVGEAIVVGVEGSEDGK